MPVATTLKIRIFFMWLPVARPGVRLRLPFVMSGWKFLRGNLRSALLR